jgi:hypothetical protein
MDAEEIMDFEHLMTDEDDFEFFPNSPSQPMSPGCQIMTRIIIICLFGGAALYFCWLMLATYFLLH